MKINLAGLPILQRSFNPFKEAYRPQIHILPETATYGNWESPKRAVIRNAGMSPGPHENGVEGLQLLQTIFRHHLPGLNVGFATPIEGAPIALKPEAPPGRFQNANAFWYDFFADAVSRDNCDIEGLHKCRRCLSLPG